MIKLVRNMFVNVVNDKIAPYDCFSGQCVSLRIEL